ncbi:MAG: insulinase family protein [Armatimonadetes bacterium]|nr:insulinase family protein [Armatimonadota bacterium]
MSNQVRKFTLANGLRVVCEPVDYVQSVAIGIWCQTGSRLETPTEAGISHLIEHMLFKGTGKRTAKEIAESIEGRGGHLNAFTDREQTCYYARVLSDDLHNAVDVLSDMYLNSLMTQKDVELEKGVVQEEIRKYEDSPEEHVHDLHARHRWGDHPLGRPIIGSHESVGSFRPDDLRDYMKRRYVAAKTVVAAAGNLDPDQLKSVCEQELGGLEGDFNLPNASPPTAATGDERISKDAEQVHFCIGGDSVTIYDDRRYASGLLDAMLGGSMSSRLFQEIREKRGLAYAIGTYQTLYREAGAFTIYGGTSPATYEQVLGLVHEEIKKVREAPVPGPELERAKRMAIGGIVMALEGMSGRMRRIASNEITHGRHIPVEQTIESLNAVTPGQVQDIANEFLDPEKLATTAIGPF